MIQAKKPKQSRQRGESSGKRKWRPLHAPAGWFCRRQPTAHTPLGLQPAALPAAASQRAQPRALRLSAVRRCLQGRGPGKSPLSDRCQWASWSAAEAAPAAAAPAAPAGLQGGAAWLPRHPPQLAAQQSRGWAHQQGRPPLAPTAAARWAARGRQTAWQSARAWGCLLPCGGGPSQLASRPLWCTLGCGRGWPWALTRRCCRRHSRSQKRLAGCWQPRRSGGRHLSDSSRRHCRPLVAAVQAPLCAAEMPMAPPAQDQPRHSAAGRRVRAAGQSPCRLLPCAVVSRCGLLLLPLPPPVAAPHAWTAGPAASPAGSAALSARHPTAPWMAPLAGPCRCHRRRHCPACCCRPGWHFPCLAGGSCRGALASRRCCLLGQPQTARCPLPTAAAPQLCWCCPQARPGQAGVGDWKGVSVGCQAGRPHWPPPGPPAAAAPAPGCEPACMGGAKGEWHVCSHCRMLYTQSILPASGRQAETQRPQAGQPRPALLPLPTRTHL